MGRIISIFINAYIFNGIGASVKWVYFRIISLFTKEPPKKFSEIYHGPEDLNDYDQIMYSYSNWGAAIIFIMLLIFIIKYLGI